MTGPADSSAPAPRRFPWLSPLTPALLALTLGAACFGFLTDRRAGRLESERARALEQRDVAEINDAESRRELVETRRESTERRERLLREHRERLASSVTEILRKRPAEADALTGWSAAAAPVKDLLENALAAEEELPPPLPDGNLEARWQLARLLMALGHDDAALPHLERISRDLAAAAATAVSGITEFQEGPPDADETDARKLLSARVAAGRGRIFASDRRMMEAAPLLQEASTLYEDWLTGRADDPEISREYARNSLLEGRALAERKQPDEARNAFLRVTALLGRPEDDGFLPEDSLLLAEATLESAALDDAAGRATAASEQHMAAIRTLVDFDRRHPDSLPCRSLLVRGYTGLGRLLSRSGAVGDAGIAFMEAVKLLTALTKEQPHETAWRLRLAQTYDEVARLVRASKPGPEGAKEALEYQDGSVRFLRNLNETAAQDPRWRRPLAEALVLNGELQEAAGNPVSALERYREALEITTTLLKGGAVLSDTDRRACHRLAGRALGASAAPHEKAGRKKEAAAALRQALREWEQAFPDGTGADAETRQAMEGAAERLKKLEGKS